MVLRFMESIALRNSLLDLFYRDRLFGTHCYAGFTPQAIGRLSYSRLVLISFEHLGGAHIDTFAAYLALGLINLG